MILRAQNQLHELPHSAGAAGMGAHEIDARTQVADRVGRRGRQADAAEDREVHDVVAHVGDLVVCQHHVPDDLIICFDFARDALIDESDAQLRRPLRRGRRQTR